MPLLDNLLVQDPYRTDHQQAQVAHNHIAQLPVADLLTVDVQTKALSLNAAAIQKFDLKIENHPLVHLLIQHDHLLFSICLSAV